MTAVAILSSKFQISIPKSVREAEGWMPGQKFVFLPKGAGFVLMPVPKSEDLAGSAKNANPDGYRDRQERR
jgi:AbrB family looped-hinge helix DNA binding protein